MRFRSKEDLTKFYENPFYLEVPKEHVEPYCHGLMNVMDYESEVEDDILPIFHKGEAFNYGVEFVLLIAFVEDAISGPAENALTSFQELTMDFPSLIVQCTQGSNFNFSCEEYTHGMVIRFRSFEAFGIFLTSSKYRDELGTDVNLYALVFGESVLNDVARVQLSGGQWAVRNLAKIHGESKHSGTISMHAAGRSKSYTRPEELAHYS
ncbi:Dimeric alpha-beta barrel [Corchorus capsularis]|uniref:Dimeric alpha-beta barrel n=1 Tax=Corchorus capsularis TaxID=210143 RepID=A0A1R3GC41_COCAP|nr:Dimeric alpha-beta barrel [Corchorus capsularis]